jgi:hypothetical protein
MDAAAADPDDPTSARMLDDIKKEIATEEAMCKELEKQVAVLQKQLVSENPVPACHLCEVMITKLLVEADGKDEMKAKYEAEISSSLASPPATPTTRHAGC